MTLLYSYGNGKCIAICFQLSKFRPDLTTKTNDDVAPEMLRPDTSGDEVDDISEFLPVDKVGNCVDKYNALDFTMKSPWRSYKKNM